MTHTPRNSQPLTVTFRGMEFTLQGTGGGCTAYEHRAEDGSGYLLTVIDDARAPRFGEPATLGHYADVWDASTIIENEAGQLDCEEISAFWPDDVTPEDDELCYWCDDSYPSSDMVDVHIVGELKRVCVTCKQAIKSRS